MSEILKKSEAQKHAEAIVEGFRDDLGPFVVAAEATRMPMIFTDSSKSERHIIFANDSFVALTGYSRDEVLGQDFYFLIKDGTQSAAVAKMSAEFNGAPSGTTELCCHRKDGTAFWVTVFINPVRNRSGDIVQYFACFLDLTEQKREKDQSRMLIDELNHRVKNTLSVVKSIVSQGLRSSHDPALVQDLIESRLLALSRSHDLLALENWQSAGLLELMNEALKPFVEANGAQDRFIVNGSNVRLPPNIALALGIAFHELATNAVKYGALSNDTGWVRVDWVIAPSPEGDRIQLCWQENGGPSVAVPTRKCFGSRVIERGLAHELLAEVHLQFLADGLVCTIDIPAPHAKRAN